MPAPPTYASFLVRLWREAEPESPESAADWQGEVVHIQTSGRLAFGSLEELHDLLRRQAEQSAVLGRAANE